MSMCDTGNLMYYGIIAILVSVLEYIVLQLNKFNMILIIKNFNEKLCHIDI